MEEKQYHSLGESESLDESLDNMGDFIPVQKQIQNMSVQQQATHTPPLQYNDNPVDNNTYKIDYDKVAEKVVGTMFDDFA